MPPWPFRRRHEPREAPREPSEQELQITRGLQSLREANAKELMTPRVDVAALAAPVRFADVVLAVRRSGRSHYPVYEEDLDHLLGVLYVKDVLLGADIDRKSGAAAGIDPEQDLTIRLREAYIVPESRSALEILSEMRRRRRSFAVVVDEYGGFSGVLTINDLVSELVGDIHDEYDRSVSPSVLRIDSRRFLVDGSTANSDLEEEIGIDIPDGEYVTLGGFLFDAFGKIPDEGDCYELDDWKLRVTKMDRRRIAKVVIEAPSTNIDDTAGATSAPGGK